MMIPIDVNLGFHLIFLLQVLPFLLLYSNPIFWEDDDS